ncbi:hypothetical protein GOB87_08325 [Acetobacter estunensis]|uniref:Uncharacterized protein n=1 Tax=Acetobacter estunensis TaxID=104097 RepID=A0A967EHQ0_9PROT|nr:hypothetical protein [Acetobacter estunensis]NHO53962.1 hypothetical protein [Acetobacter estunensis]
MSGFDFLGTHIALGSIVIGLIVGITSGSLTRYIWYIMPRVIDSILEVLPWSKRRRIANTEKKIKRYYVASIRSEEKLYWLRQSHANIVISFCMAFLCFVISIWALVGLDYVSVIYRIYGKSHNINDFNNPKIGPAIQFLISSIAGSVFLIQTISSVSVYLQYNNASKTVSSLQQRLAKLTGGGFEKPLALSCSV